MRCSACKRELPFGHVYWACSVSTCNRARTRLVFCSISCWDSHVAVLRHRDAWSVESVAPSRIEWAREQEAESAPPPVAAPRVAAAPSPQSAEPARDVRDVLIVVSKLKKYIRDRSGMNTSDDVVEVLSDCVRAICDDAIRAAGSAGRKTVLDRDVPRIDVESIRHSRG
jgi:histone H3/H4